MTIFCCNHQGVLVPQTTLRTEPLEHTQMATTTRTQARASLPRAAVGMKPEQHTQLATFCCAPARALTQRAALRVQPADLHQPPLSGETIAQLRPHRQSARDRPGQLAQRGESAAVHRRRPVPAVLLLRERDRRAQ
eukprot:CAMPEP_0179988806 /NCGR_PEP_ID=MMETSP0984-20121128/3503_1 /TAXON_ID=483367 /ORGANISM="non described non described, Strain CCMP 2436" /LENGTH=135 /DNA_ID=CAMNT_0021907765 /DNA_START=165 /DNA_END=569 /DNA_ORIENTATION=+